ncbi:hypothetical protein [Bogoriella caseilytica]|uniref:Uncharacterized protein n=1 Tax=Bogoriella caseilytica TaxID=56055 RepID=A0A3N2BA06_9MICO|nr:hypothetical protein [Bogoriella caseilytica]ROR72086.1 hypothetical protein EDD31_0432 [Bogoriella caseilytica]
MRMIWATRGRSWGFRFLDDGGFPDPLPEYERAFAAVASEPEVCERAGAAVALRFADPIGRRDAAGRLIRHSFVLFSPVAAPVSSVSHGVDLVWPLVAQRYARAYREP